MRKDLCYNNSKIDKETVIMTKSDIEEFVRRYSKIKYAIENKKPECSFYVGNRKKRIIITEEVRMLYETVQEIIRYMQEDWVKDLIKQLLAGKSDVYLFQFYPCGRTLYYTIKRDFIETIYRCCIAKQMISYEELLRIGLSR